MGYAPDFTHDLECLYGLKTYTLKVEGKSDLVLSKCVMEHPRMKREMEPTDGQVLQRDREFVWDAFHTDPIVGDVPIGSVLVDTRQTYWTILALKRIESTETLTASCRNLSIVTATGDDPNAGLNTVTILKAQYSKGRANEAKATWLGYVSGLETPTEADQVTCRLQPSSTDAMIRFTAEWSKETKRAIFQEQLPIDLAAADYRLLDSAGGRYRIMAYYDAERIDKLPTAIVVAITEGVEYFRGTQGPPAPLPHPVLPS